jgi:hypothetical protein
LPKEKVTKRIRQLADPTADLDPLRLSEASKFTPPSLKLLIFAPQKSYAELFYAQLAEFVAKSSVRLKYRYFFYLIYTVFQRKGRISLVKIFLTKNHDLLKFNQ